VKVVISEYRSEHAATTSKQHAAMKTAANEALFTKVSKGIHVIDNQSRLQHVEASLFKNGPSFVAMTTGIITLSICMTKN
jgi:predicted aspartyl protease